MTHPLVGAPGLGTEPGLRQTAKRGDPSPELGMAASVIGPALPIPSVSFTKLLRRTVTGVRLRGLGPPDIMRAGPLSRPGGQTDQGTSHGPERRLKV